jgi:hypothetical protein
MKGDELRLAEGIEKKRKDNVFENSFHFTYS